MSPLDAIADNYPKSGSGLDQPRRFPAGWMFHHFVHQPGVARIKVMKNDKGNALGRDDALKISQFINWVDEMKSEPAVIYVRVSDRSQRGHLRHQKADLVAELTKRGFSIICTIREIAEGSQAGRSGLRRAIMMAKAMGAIVVAESTDRFWRRRDPDGKLQPLTLREINLLLSEADGVPLATFHHPDMSLSDVRREQTKRGQAGSGNYGGRPKARTPKKARRERWSPEARRLRKRGYSFRQIAKRLGLPTTVVWSWANSTKTERAANGG